MFTRAKWWIRGVLLALGFASMLWLSVGIHNVFASPDESANAFFSRRFADTWNFCVEEPLNTVAQGLIHPRSMVAPGTCILPASFLGFPILNGLTIMIFGAFGSAMASLASVLFTPVLATLALLAWWWLVRHVSHDEYFADLATFLVLVHPAWWYYGARVTMHNVPFVAFLMIASALVAYAHDRQSRIIGFMSGIVLGIALTMRLVELPIIALLTCFAAVWYRKSLSWRKVYRHPFFFVFLGAVVIIIGYFIVNHAVYGAWFSTGYNLPDTRAVNVAVPASEDSSAPFVDHVLPLLIPFGVHPRAMVRNVLQYGVQLYPILSCLSGIGIVLAWRARKESWKLGAILLLGAATWMAVVYGSWSMADNINPNAVTVGNSHVRYWLPLFVGSSVFGAYALRKLVEHSRAMSIVVLGILLAIMGTSARTVFGGTDGLLATRVALLSYQEKRERVIGSAACTEGGDARPVIVVDHADKYLFPTCRVIVPLRSDATYSILPTLVDAVPVYYFGLTLPESDVNYLNTIKLPPLQMQIEYLETIGDQSLYRFVKREDVVK